MILKKLFKYLFIFALVFFSNCVTEEINEIADTESEIEECDSIDCKKDKNSFIDKMWDNIKNTIKEEEL